MKFSKAGLSLSHAMSALRDIAIYAVFIVTLVLAGCMKPGSRATDPNADFSDPTKSNLNQAAATFYNEEVTGSAIVTQNLPGFSIPSEKLFSFKTCIFDKRTREAIKGHSFVVKGGATDIQARSEESGCINWSEKIAYDGVADAKYIPIKRTIYATGMHSGARELSLCVNPWNYDGSEAVRDCARRPVPDDMLVASTEVSSYLKGLSKSGEKTPRHLWIDDLRMNSVHNPGGSDGAMIDFSISIGPKVLMRNIKGDEDPMTLKDGLFTVQLWIVAKTGIKDSRCTVISKSEPTMELAMVAGRLREELKMKVRYMSTYGQLELVGTVKPKAGPNAIRPYDGVWTLGDHTGLLGMKWGFERPPAYKSAPGEFSAKKYVESCIDISDGVKEADAIKLIGSKSSKTIDLPKGTPETVFAGGSLKKLSTGPDGKIRIEVPSPLVKSAIGASDADKARLSPKFIDVDADLMRDDCVDQRDLPRLFPIDNAKAPINPGPDILTCINKAIQPGMTKVEQFEFSPVDVRPEPILDPVNSETTVDRTIKFRVISRVTNPMAQNAAVRDMDFTVETDSGTTNVRTNHLGDLIFNDMIDHLYYQPERFMIKLVKISHPSGFSKRLAIVLVPWDNNGFQFARDIRGLTKQTIAQMNLVPRPASQMLITGYNWGTIGFRYQVDNYLSLKIFKQFMLALEPRALRYSSFTHGRMANEPLRDGLYLMKVAVQKDYQPLGGGAQEFITGIRTLVPVRAGKIVVPVEMMFRDFKVLKLRSNLLIELETIDERKLPIEIRQAAFSLQQESKNADSRSEHLVKLESEFYNIVYNKTKVKMAPLDSYVDRTSGLAARTFVGAVVPYSNGFNAAVRATDELLEVSCPTGNTVDCDELKSNDDIPPSERSERAKLYGDIKHLYRMSVTRLLERQAVLEAKYVKEMHEKTRMSELLHVGNLEYLALTNEQEFVQQALKMDPKLATSNKILTPGAGYKTFADQFTRFEPQDKFEAVHLRGYYTILNPNWSMGSMAWATPPPRRPTKAQMLEEFKSNLFDSGQLTREQSIKTCVFLMENLMLRANPDAEKAMSFGQRGMSSMARKELNASCLFENILQVERKLRVFKLYDFERGGGNLMALNVGANSSFDRSEGFSFSYGLNAGGLASGAIGLVSGGASKFLDLLGVSIGISKSTSGGTSIGSSVAGSATIGVELRRMDLTMGAFERCTVVRLSPQIAQSTRSKLMIYMRNIPKNDLQEHVSRGMMICEGFERKEPLKVAERYYQFSQSIGDEVINDPTDINNQPYLFGLRGRGDYVRFIRTIEARPTSVWKLDQDVSVGELANDRLMAIFGEATPTYPGVLSIEPNVVTTLKPIMHTKDLPAKK
ncbi:MAG: hypothetical protein J0L82_14325 [Deltaproteobacteria bacterium]|nr:hypothetical protein [Deltaproteobacteria bacterium]